MQRVRLSDGLSDRLSHTCIASKLMTYEHAVFMRLRGDLIAMNDNSMQ